MDLVTRSQIEDAVRNEALVRERVETVALKVADIKNATSGVEDARWQLAEYRIDLKTYPDGMAHLRDQVWVVLRTSWEDRPKTDKFGDPDDDEEEDDRYGYSREYMVRRFNFPVAYLLTNDWMSDAETEAERMRRWYRAHHLEYAEKKLVEDEKELAERRIEIAARRKAVDAETPVEEKAE